MNKLQVELLLRLSMILAALTVFWEFYWMLIYDVLFWEKQYYFFAYLSEWLIITVSIIILAMSETLLGFVHG